MVNDLPKEFNLTKEKLRELSKEELIYEYLKLRNKKELQEDLF